MPDTWVVVVTEGQALVVGETSYEGPVDGLRVRLASGETAVGLLSFAFDPALFQLHCDNPLLPFADMRLLRGDRGYKLSDLVRLLPQEAVLGDEVTLMVASTQPGWHIVPARKGPDPKERPQLEC